MELFFLVIAVIAIVQMVRMHQHTKTVQVIAERIEGRQEEQRVLLGALLHKLKKMDAYKDALYFLDDSEVTECFKELIAEEERHLKVLKEALARKPVEVRK